MFSSNYLEARDVSPKKDLEKRQRENQDRKFVNSIWERVQAAEERVWAALWKVGRSGPTTSTNIPTQVAGPPLAPGPAIIEQSPSSPAQPDAQDVSLVS